MKLTHRQETFFLRLLDLCRETNGPIHYSTLAEKVGVSPFTAYDLNQHIKGWKKIHLSVMHADSMEQAKGLQKALSDLYPSLEVPIEPFTPVMGAHTGPGLFGMGYYFE